MRDLLFYIFCNITIEDVLKQHAALFQCGNNIAEIAIFIEGLSVKNVYVRNDWTLRYLE